VARTLHRTELLTPRDGAKHSRLEAAASIALELTFALAFVMMLALTPFVVAAMTLARWLRWKRKPGAYAAQPSPRFLH
jgi:hypothetical protein